MITLSNGHQFEFCCASGALGFDGEGYWWEQPFKWVGLLDTAPLTVITKTLTHSPRQGNLEPWRPWRCVHVSLDGTVTNAVGLTNPGYQWWLRGPYKHIKKKGYKVVASIAPDSPEEARVMARDFNAADLVGVEINASCPNVEHGSVDYVYNITDQFCRHTKHPVILKLSFSQPYLGICKALEGRVEAFDLINAVPWGHVFSTRSPLDGKGGGGVSGPRIAPFAREALRAAKGSVRTPVISGGGVTTLEETLLRFRLGADAVSFGTVFLKTPWRVNKIIRSLERA